MRVWFENKGHLDLVPVIDWIKVFNFMQLIDKRDAKISTIFICKTVRY
jgi:hypothetical protein